MKKTTPAGLDEDLFDGRWDDGRPKRWPTAQLRVRGRPFDIYCDHHTDITLDGYGVPVVLGRTADRADLRRGWMQVERSATPPDVR